MTYISDRVKKVIEQQGISITYTHITESVFDQATMTTSNTETVVVIQAHFRKFAAKEITGLIKEGDRQLRIAADSVSFVPERNDTILTSEGNFTIKSVDSRTAYGDPAVYICVARGG